MTNDLSNVESEKALLGMMFIGLKSKDLEHEGLKADCFYDSKNKLVYETMLKMENEGLSIDEVTLANYARKNNIDIEIKLINDLTDQVPTKSNYQFYLSNVIDAYNKRKALKRIDEVQAEIKSCNSADIEKVLSDASRLLTNTDLATLGLPQKDSVLNYRSDFDNYIEKSKKESFIPTGFSEFDKLLDGGLYPGLHIIGAISSLGKTTFCLQIADQIARYQKKDVLIFSLEMSRAELIAKSISRITSELDIQRSRSNTFAKTTRGILTGARYKNYSQRELDLIEDSKELYFKDVAPNFYIYEGMGNVGTEQVRRRVEAYRRINGKAPVVIIDYVQLLQPPCNNFGTDKQITDYNMTELKRISRDNNAVVIGISSFNRESYTSAVSMSSFKESGAIEYSSDVLIALQYKKYADLNNVKDTERKGKVAEINEVLNQKIDSNKPIEIQAVVLKQRNGRKGNVGFDYYPMFNKFNEMDEELESRLHSRN